MSSVQVSPEWYTAACKNLALIEENAADYEDPEEGDKAPSEEVFTAVRAFLNLLRNKHEDKLEEPRMFVSSNGHLLLCYGNKNQSLDLRFDPNLSFFFQHAEKPPASGSEVADAIELLCKYFRV